MKKLINNLKTNEKIYFKMTFENDYFYVLDKYSEHSYSIQKFLKLERSNIDCNTYNIEKITNKYISVYDFLGGVKITAKISIENIEIINNNKK